jgi:hypothetical protein
MADRHVSFPLHPENPPHVCKQIVVESHGAGTMMTDHGAGRANSRKIHHSVCADDDCDHAADQHPKGPTVPKGRWRKQE